MTRKEECYAEALRYVENNHSKAGNDFQNAMNIAVLKAYMAGAQWADEHPKEGFIDINKIYEWFYTYFYVHPHDCHVVQYDSDEPFEDMDDFVEQFRKAMTK